MKYQNIFLMLLLCLGIASCDKDDDQKKAAAKKAAQQKAAHDAFVGDAPKPEPAYNIMDYAKNPSAARAGGQNSSAPNSDSSQKP